MISSIARPLVLRTLQHASGGHLKVSEQGRTILVPNNEPCVDIVIDDPRAYYSMLRAGAMGAAEAYMAGWWSSPHLGDLMRVMVDQFNQMDDTARYWTKFKWYRYITALNKRGIRAILPRYKALRDISYHYNLGNDFFALFLDNTMSYSCAVFPNKNMTLEEASRHKLEMICQKLDIQSGERFLDLGCGWGALAFYATETRHCQTVAVTLSREQYKYVADKIKERSLSDQMEVVYCDYRDFHADEPFDKIGSVEMIEAVGVDQFEIYFRRIAKLLSRKGSALVQAILIPDHRYAAAAVEEDFIRKYIFPGGALPSMQVINNALKHAGLIMRDVEQIGHHYAPTLAEWCRRFMQQIEQARALKFDQKFCRMWEYYLRYCEGSFAVGAIHDAQFLFSRR